MNDRTKEKIVELCKDLETLPCCDTYEGQAEYLISNGVAVIDTLIRITKFAIFDRRAIKCSI